MLARSSCSGSAPQRGGSRCAAACGTRASSSPPFSPSLGLLEAFGRRRPLVLGLLAGAAFSTRATLLAALPYWGWRALPDRVREGLPARLVPAARVALRRGAWLALGFAPALAFALWYNAVRFGNPFESGYGLAALPAFLEARRQLGVFSLAHLSMNLEYFIWHLGRSITTFPWFKPDGLGMSVLLTSPGLLLAVRADWRRRETIALGLTALLVLVPSLLYYGGGWWQFGYRYALDCFPFVLALCAMAAARHGIGWRWKAADPVRGRGQPLRGVLELQPVRRTALCPGVRPRLTTSRCPPSSTASPPRSGRRSPACAGP